MPGKTGKRERRLKPFYRIARLILIIYAIALFFRWSNHSLQVTRWKAVFPDLPDGFDHCRIVILADLHGAEFGENNQKLFQTIAKQSPEYIFYLGDLEDSFRGPVENYAEQIADGLSKIAPVFYITGNHEWAIGSVPRLKKRLTEHGVTVLSNNFVILRRDQSELILAGIDDPNGYAGQKSPEALRDEIDDLYGDDKFWFLLAHRNDYFPREYYALGADMVFSGHGHGGLIRLPFTDGLVSTSRTFFPSWTAGFYDKGDSRLFVTRGLGNSGRTFRLFNRPEIAVITLRKA